jgi:hypothetical protein
VLALANPSKCALPSAVTLRAVSSPPPEDPEDLRIEQLLLAQRRGTAGEAQREELAIYLRDRPELGARIDENARAAELGAGWLERVERDDRVQVIERSPRARLERAIGLGTVLAGWLLHFPLPLVGFALSAGGMLLLLYSILRVRRSTRDTDPYEDVMR